MRHLFPREPPTRARMAFAEAHLAHVRARLARYAKALNRPLYEIGQYLTKRTLAAAAALHTLPLEEQRRLFGVIPAHRARRPR